MFARVIAGIFGLFLVLILSIATMIYGWGLEPKSWLWIIGGGIILRMIVEVLSELAKKKEK